MGHPLASSLLLSDLHLTTNERDEYRWGVFPWVREQRGVARLFILGDLTDAKDYHPSRLVNRLVSELETTAALMEVHILRGNHDGIDPEWPYFRFLNAIPNIHFYHEPSHLGDDTRVLMLPHTRDWRTDWEELDFSDYEVILLHATVQGAEAEAGGTLSGVPKDLFADTRALILAGDVHVPQKVGNVEYIGAPYPIRFGDPFIGRALYFDQKGRRQNLHYPTLGRHSLRISGPEQLDPKELIPGDQYKIRVVLDKASALGWTKVKQEVKNLVKAAGADLVSLELERAPDTKAVSLKKRVASVSPIDILGRYCAQKGIPPALRSRGEEVLKMTLANAAKTL